MWVTRQMADPPETLGIDWLELIRQNVLAQLPPSPEPRALALQFLTLALIHELIEAHGWGALQWMIEEAQPAMLRDVMQWDDRRRKR